MALAIALVEVAPDWTPATYETPSSAKAPMATPLIVVVVAVKTWGVFVVVAVPATMAEPVSLRSEFLAPDIATLMDWPEFAPTWKVLLENEPSSRLEPLN